MGRWALAAAGITASLAAALVFVRRRRMRLPSSAVLLLDLEKPFAESTRSPLPPFLTGGTKYQDLHEVLQTLRRASSDPRVKGVLVRTGDGFSCGPAQGAELRRALGQLQKSGKWAVGYADSFGLTGSANINYWVLSVCQRVFLQPAGDVGLVGLAALQPFVKKALDYMKIKPQWQAREEYKNLGNIFLEKEYTSAHREATASLINSLWKTMVEDISASRNMTTATVQSLADSAPFSAKISIEKNLVDDLAHIDQVFEFCAIAAEKGLKEAPTFYSAENAFDLPRLTQLNQKMFLKMTEYISKTKKKPLSIKSLFSKKKNKNPPIAVIVGSGSIVRGEENPMDAARGQKKIYAKTFARHIAAAAADDTIKCIILRIDSPGGDVIASEYIWRAIRCAQTKKKVVVSMGNVCASGGYFISTHADSVVAEATTVTGSIGVTGGKFVIGEAAENFGITHDAVMTEMNESQMHRFSQWMDVMYDDFVSRVAHGRNIPIERVRSECAKGRVWTGEQAQKLGLVDCVGGVDVAVEEACRLSHLSPALFHTLTLSYPPPAGISEMVAQLSGQEPSRNILPHFRFLFHVAAFLPLRSLFAFPHPLPQAPELAEAAEALTEEMDSSIPPPQYTALLPTLHGLTLSRFL